MFKPAHKHELKDSELDKAQGTLMFITEKRDGTIKARTVYDGRASREWLSKEDTRSPTVSLEGLMLSMCIDASEERDIMTADVPNAFVQTDMPDTNPGDDRVIMKIEGILADMLVEIAPEIYSPYAVKERGRTVLYLIVLKAIYGQLFERPALVLGIQKGLGIHWFCFQSL